MSKMNQVIFELNYPRFKISSIFLRFLKEKFQPTLQEFPQQFANNFRFFILPSSNLSIIKCHKTSYSQILDDIRGVSRNFNRGGFIFSFIDVFFLLKFFSLTNLWIFTIEGGKFISNPLDGIIERSWSKRFC